MAVAGPQHCAYCGVDLVVSNVLDFIRGEEVRWTHMEPTECNEPVPCDALFE